MRTFEITTTGNHVICWEDQSLGDADYQDLVVEVIGAVAVPEPGTLALLAAGGVLTLLRRRRVKL